MVWSTWWYIKCYKSYGMFSIYAWWMLKLYWHQVSGKKMIMSVYGIFCSVKLCIQGLRKPLPHFFMDYNETLKHMISIKHRCSQISFVTAWFTVCWVMCPWIRAAIHGSAVKHLLPRVTTVVGKWKCLCESFL